MKNIYAPSRVFMIDFGTPCHKNRFAVRRIIYALARPPSTSPMHKTRMAKAPSNDSTAHRDKILGSMPY